MSRLSKRESSAQLMSQIESNISCPNCKSSMRVDVVQLTCEKGHSFDIAKQGYVNLLTRAVKTNYHKELFDSRRKLITESVFFAPLHQKLTELIIEVQGSSRLFILDAGSGEGSHLYKIHHGLLDYTPEKITAAGIDIAKEGILKAAKYYGGQNWFVADLANIPFQNQTVNIILNILSPANYDEFTRVLEKDGLAIKVVPQKDYLIQLREFNDDRSKHDTLYSNEPTVELFYQHFKDVEKIDLQYDVLLDEEHLDLLLHMTPLTWNWSDEKTNNFKASGIRSISVDFDILIGYKKL